MQLKRTTSSLFYCIPVTFLFLLSGTSSAIQPVDIIAENPERYFVRQGSAQCGPASFYMIFKYYGDNLKPYPFFYDSSGLPVDLGGNAGNGDTVKENSPVSLWVKGKDLSTDWSRLPWSIKKIYFKNKDGMYQRYYQQVESNDSIIGIEHKNTVIRSNIFLNRIVSGFLEQNRPVIVHLKRRWPFPGHYIVLIGYNKKDGNVSYMDPSGETGNVINTVPLGDFLNRSWYKGKSTAWWGGACWNGRWVGFYHSR